MNKQFDLGETGVESEVYIISVRPPVSGRRHIPTWYQPVWIACRVRSNLVSEEES